MRIENVEIYDMCESIAASGMPMLERFDETAFAETVGRIHGEFPSAQHHFDRARRLASAPANSGHCNYLKGIIVSANISGTIKWWEQFQRYHFVTIISSMSTMHRIDRMDMTNCMSDKVLHDTKTHCAELVKRFKNGEIDFDTLIDNMPLGIVLTARTQTNYLQLRTIWNQRKNHKDHEWKPFCRWLESLPRAKELITVDGNEMMNEER